MTGPRVCGAKQATGMSGQGPARSWDSVVPCTRSVPGLEELFGLVNSQTYFCRRRMFPEGRKCAFGATIGFRPRSENLLSDATPASLELRT